MKIEKTDYAYAFTDSGFLRKMHICQLLAELTIMKSSVLPLVKRVTHIDHYSRLNIVTSIQNAIVHEDWLTCLEIYLRNDIEAEILEEHYIRIFSVKCL
jgi:hypothetical protein